MNSNPLPLTRELVLIGGGHTHALVLRKWGMNPLPGVRLTVINPSPTAPYTGMLPGFIAGHYVRDDLSIDLVRLARFAGARLIVGAVDGIDRQARRIHIQGRPPLAYDVASINVGITSDLPDLPGFTEHTVAAKPLGAYAEAWHRFRDAVSCGKRQPVISVIGAGVGGIELSLAMAHALRQDGHNAQITVIERDTALPGLGTHARSVLKDELTKANVILLEGIAPVWVGADAIELSDDRRIASEFTLGVVGARPHDWLAETGLALRDGFIEVDAYLRSSDPAIYAAADCVALPDTRPKVGVFAVRQAPVLYHNLRTDLAGGNRRKFRPQRDYLKLVSLGGKTAYADNYGLRVKGGWIWRWKDWIDRRFMSKFKDLPVMAAPQIPAQVASGVIEAIGEKPMCGGCGSKVGASALASVLDHLPKGNRNDIQSRLGDDAATLNVGGQQQVFTTDHLRSFTEDPWIMTRIAAVHAMGDIWAMGAAPQAALATIILPRLATLLQEN